MNVGGVERRSCGVERRSCGADVRSLGAEKQSSGVPERSLGSALKADSAHRIWFGEHHHERGAHRAGNELPEHGNGRVLKAVGAGERRHGGPRRGRGEGLTDREAAVQRIGGIAPTTDASRGPRKAPSSALEESSDRAEWVRRSLVDQSSRAEWRRCRSGWRNRPSAVTRGSLKSTSDCMDWSSGDTKRSIADMKSSVGAKAAVSRIVDRRLEIAGHPSRVVKALACRPSPGYQLSGRMQGSCPRRQGVRPNIRHRHPDSIAARDPRSEPVECLTRASWISSRPRSSASFDRPT